MFVIYTCKDWENNTDYVCSIKSNGNIAVYVYDWETDTMLNPKLYADICIREVRAVDPATFIPFMYPVVEKNAISKLTGELDKVLIKRWAFDNEQLYNLLAERNPMYNRKKIEYVDRDMYSI